MKKVFMVSMVLALGLFLHGFAIAQTTGDDVMPSGSIMPGTTQGTGTHFEVTDSEYLNIVLDSSETITLRLESVPEMVTMNIEAASNAASTQITLTGFEPLTTYYKYEDDYHNLVELTTDGNGSYSWAQDLSQSHLVFVQPKKSTKFIKDDATGGDCTSIGTWDSATKTCTLTTDINETIQIDSNNITLDGNGHMVGSGYGYGVYLYGKTAITIKNVSVKNFTYGISLYYSSNNILTNNTVSNNRDKGIFLGSSNNNTITGNIASNNSYGISLVSSAGNNITNNTVQENSWDDISIEAYSDAYCNNVIQDNIGSGGRPIKYFNSAVNLKDEILSGLILCNADYSTINNVIIKGSETLKNNGLFLSRTDYSTITKTTSSGSSVGIYVISSNNNAFTNNTVSNSSYGIIIFYYSTNNTLDRNNISNSGRGIAFDYFSSNNTMSSNTISNNSFGVLLSLSSNNKIYNNSFINNAPQAYVWQGGGNVFNLEKPTGGNYWSDFDTPTEGCSDTNYDGFCDASYNFYGGTDSLPWTKQSGWLGDTTSPTTTTTISGTSGDNGWYISDVQVTLTTTDNEGGSGVKKTEYSFDGTTWNTYSSPFTVNSESTTTVYYKSTDNADNIETTKSTPIKIDKTSPTTSAVISATSGNNDWYISDIQITFTAVDNANGSGIKEIHYNSDGGTETIVAGSSTSVIISTDGTHTITYYAVDIAGNSETSHSATFKMDKTSPIITVSGVTDGATYALGLVPKVSYTATDATSGVATSSDSLTGGDSYGMGTFTYTVTATDNAGNVATQSATYTVIATMEGLIELINQFLNSGDIDNSGIANSLISKVSNALDAKNSGNEQASDNIMQAFINQVEAQSGKHISTYAVAILINAATYIINN